MIKFLVLLGLLVTLANAAVTTVFIDGLNFQGRQKVENILEVFDI
ncbi:hypothetical protein ACRXCV_14565 [Halobacteriovorax sp. GFR7]